MEAKEQFTDKEHAKIYCSYRRNIPKIVIDKIVSSLREKYDGPLDLAVDMGCGSGQSTVNLASYFKKVHGIDVSEAQIEEAKATRALPNVTYENAPAEIIPFGDGTVQIVAAGSSLHWFHLEAFFPEVRRALCNNGILAVSNFYTIKPLLDRPELNEKIDEIWKEILNANTSYYAPQAKIAYNRYRDINFPFEEVQRFENEREVFDGKFQDVIGYLTSLSGFQNWKKREEEKAVGFLSHIEKRIRDVYTESSYDADGPLKLYRDYCLIICRKIVDS